MLHKNFNMALQDLTIIKENITFERFLTTSGYVKMKRKKINHIDIYSSETDAEIEELIFVGIVDKEEKYIALPLGDTGDIVHFVNNRIETKKRAENFNISTSSIVDTTKILMEHLAKNDSSIRDLEVSDFTSNSWKEFKNRIFTIYYQIDPLTNISYFENLGINKGTVFSEVFIDKIGNAKGIRYNNKQYEVDNVVFPLSDSVGQQKGLYYENDFKVTSSSNSSMPFFAKFSNLNLFWQSNRVAKNNTLTIVSKPIEALAHYQYYEEKSNYISLFDVDRYTLSELNKIFTEMSEIQLCLSVSTLESLKELEIICSLCEDRVSIHQVNETDLLIQIETNKGNKADKNLANFISALKRKNQTIIKRLIKTLGSSSAPYKDDELFLVATKDEYIYVNCPKNYNIIYNLCDAMIKSFDFRKKIRIDKPSYHSWIKQNQKLPKGNKSSQKNESRHLNPTSFRDKTYQVVN